MRRRTLLATASTVFLAPLVAGCSRDDGGDGGGSGGSGGGDGGSGGGLYRMTGADASVGPDRSADGADGGHDPRGDAGTDDRADPTGAPGRG